MLRGLRDGVRERAPDTTQPGGPRYLPSTLSLPEIARELYVSPNTVKTQCNAIYRKLAVTSRQAAVQAAREHRLL
jgi:LuxR family transcriptional regulator, maltose regulon positive regulatory protein